MYAFCVLDVFNISVIIISVKFCALSDIVFSEKARYNGAIVRNDD